MLAGVKQFKAEWARSNVSQEIAGWARELAAQWGVGHWSRGFEYPWVLLNGDFQRGEIVLDAAGGNSPLQYIIASKNIVLNVDLNQDHLGEAERSFGHLSQAKNVFHEVGDLRKLRFPRDFFTRIMCVSALEHIESPEKVVAELWRVLSPGGKLIVTLDVASYARWNHTINAMKAREIVEELFGGLLPLLPPDLLRASFPEIDIDEKGTVIPARRGGNVELYVLCLLGEKK